MSKKNLLYGSLLILAFVLLFFLGKENRNQDALILNKGIETTGTVIDRSYGSSNSGKQFSIRFDFRVKNKTYIGVASLGNNKHYYNKAIIGMKYTVRYLPQEPDKLKNSRIYIDTPVFSEIKNIEKERSRIQKQYKSGHLYIKHSRAKEEYAKILGL